MPKNRELNVGSSQVSGPETSMQSFGFSNLRRNRSVSLSDADSEKWLRVINGCLDLGAFLGFGRTSSGGALCLMLKVNGNTEKLYAGSSEELEELLDSLIEAISEELVA